MSDETKATPPADEAPQQDAASTADNTVEFAQNEQGECTAPEAEAQTADAQAEPSAPEKPSEKTKEKKKPLSAKDAEVLKTKLAAAEAAATAAKEQLLRTAAEYENFRKRSAREADGKFNDGMSHAIQQIIPILDTLEMAEQVPCADENYKKGVTMTLDKAAKALENLRIVEIDAAGKPFDPNTMNAVSQVPAPEGANSGDVVTVYQKGYMVGDKIIRHATVVVAE